MYGGGNIHREDAFPGAWRMESLHPEAGVGAGVEEERLRGA